MVMDKSPHILLVTFPAQGHINPAFNFAKRLIRAGARVTFSSSISAISHMSKKTSPTMDYMAFSDGYDDGFKRGDDMHHFMSEMRCCGSSSLRELIQAKYDQENCVFTHVVYSILIPWVVEVAHEYNLQATLLWNQPATVLDIYYYYFHGYKDIIGKAEKVELPGLPALSLRDLPSFFLPSDTHSFVLPGFQEHMEILNKEVKPKVLVNTFDYLEPEALKALEGKYELLGIGPLVPSAFLDREDVSDTSAGDLLEFSKDYIKFLDSKADSSTIYVSFGSLATFTMAQMNEFARALIDTGRPFLWVITKKQGDELEKEDLECKEELERGGMIVEWCSQVEVLSHPSIGCFVTHCGWNSTFESLASGVPMVGFPQWSDQGTNAKLMQDVWKCGIRVNVDEDGFLEAQELKRCLDLVMGCGKDMKINANKWKHLAREAAKEGGSSDKNIRAFLRDITKY